VLPLTLKLSDKDVLVIGAGRIGTGKANCSSTPELA